MELKITADKKLLEALMELTEAIRGARPAAAAAPVTAQTAAPKEEPAEAAPAPVESKPTKPEAPVLDREAVKHTAIVKIQAGHRDAVKALIEKHGAARVGDVTDDKLAAFAAELEAL